MKKLFYLMILDRSIIMIFSPSKKIAKKFKKIIDELEEFYMEIIMSVFYLKFKILSQCTDTSIIVMHHNLTHSEKNSYNLDLIHVNYKMIYFIPFKIECSDKVIENTNIQLHDFIQKLQNY
jgi:hypothetical protein